MRSPSRSNKRTWVSPSSSQVVPEMTGSGASRSKTGSGMTSASSYALSRRGACRGGGWQRAIYGPENSGTPTRGPRLRNSDAGLRAGTPEYRICRQDLAVEIPERTPEQAAPVVLKLMLERSWMVLAAWFRAALMFDRSARSQVSSVKAPPCHPNNLRTERKARREARSQVCAFS